MPCSGCHPFLAQHTGAQIKYYCPSDGQYHYDWEPCGQIQQPQEPTQTPPSLLAPEPNQSPALTMSVVSTAKTGKNCGCCGPNGGSGVGGALSGPITTPPPTGTVNNCGDCGYTTRDVLLALIAATIFLMLVAND